MVSGPWDKIRFRWRDLEKYAWQLLGKVQSVEMGVECCIVDCVHDWDVEEVLITLKPANNGVRVQIRTFALTSQG